MYRTTNQNHRQKAMKLREIIYTKAQYDSCWWHIKVTVLGRGKGHEENMIVYTSWNTCTKTNNAFSNACRTGACYGLVWKTFSVVRTRCQMSEFVLGHRASCMSRGSLTESICLGRGYTKSTVVIGRTELSFLDSYSGPEIWQETVTGRWYLVLFFWQLLAASVVSIKQE